MYLFVLFSFIGIFFILGFFFTPFSLSIPSLDTFDHQRSFMSSKIKVWCGVGDVSVRMSPEEHGWSCVALVRCSHRHQRRRGWRCTDWTVSWTLSGSAGGRFTLRGSKFNHVFVPPEFSGTNTWQRLYFLIQSEYTSVWGCTSIVSPGFLSSSLHRVSISLWTSPRTQTRW